MSASVASLVTFPQFPQSRFSAESCQSYYGKQPQALCGNLWSSHKFEKYFWRKIFYRETISSYQWNILKVCLKQCCCKPTLHFREAPSFVGHPRSGCLSMAVTNSGICQTVQGKNYIFHCSFTYQKYHYVPSHLQGHLGKIKHTHQ